MATKLEGGGGKALVAWLASLKQAALIRLYYVYVQYNYDATN